MKGQTFVLAAGRCPGCGSMNSTNLPVCDGVLPLLAEFTCSKCLTRSDTAPCRRSSGFVYLYPVQREEYLELMKEAGLILSRPSQRS